MKTNTRHANQLWVYCRVCYVLLFVLLCVTVCLLGSYWALSFNEAVAEGRMWGRHMEGISDFFWWMGTHADVCRTYAYHILSTRSLRPKLWVKKLSKIWNSILSRGSKITKVPSRRWTKLTDQFNVFISLWCVCCKICELVLIKSNQTLVICCLLRRYLMSDCRLEQKMTRSQRKVQKALNLKGKISHLSISRHLFWMPDFRQKFLDL